MGVAADDAARLQAKVEQWQKLAADQQTLALQLGELITAQQALAEQWTATDDDEIISITSKVEEQLRGAADQVISIEEVALRRLAAVVSDLGRMLRTP